MPFGRDTLITTYAEHLAARSKALCRDYASRPYESRLAEAATFRALQRCHANPEVADSEGGPDFRCVVGAAQFAVEATSFAANKVTKDTGLQNETPEDMKVQAYSLLTRQIAEKVDEKHFQLAQAHLPGLIAIASDHFAAPFVLDSFAAQCALISQPYWTGETDNRMKVNFGNSAFLRIEDGQIVSHNRGISAAIFIRVERFASYICGALHPDPLHRFDSRLLWEIPFIYLSDWPISGSTVQCRGTLGNQETLEVPHAPIA